MKLLRRLWVLVNRRRWVTHLEKLDDFKQEVMGRVAKCEDLIRRCKDVEGKEADTLVASVAAILIDDRVMLSRVRVERMRMEMKLKG